MNKKIKLIVFGSIFTVLTMVGLNVPARDTAAEETTPLSQFTLDILETHKAEVETQAANDEKCKEHLGNKVKTDKAYKMQEKENIAENQKTMIGTFQLTAYVATGNPCASGVYPTPNHTVACNSLPLGTKIYIDGLGEYTVEDTGGMGYGVIDVFVSDYSTAIQFGRRSADVYIIED